MDYVLVSDLVRYYVVVLTSLLLVMFLRLGLQRAKAQGWGRGEHPHPLVGIGLTLIFLNIARRRFDSLGEPGDAYLWSGAVGATLITTGLALTFRWTFRKDNRDHHPE